MPDDHCQPIREMISAKEQEIRDLEEWLGESPIGVRPMIQERIDNEKVHLRQLNVSLVACEQGRES
jgi:hypothetical protein